MAKQPAPAHSYELEATDVLARYMRGEKRWYQLAAAAVLLIAAALHKHGANGNGHGK